MTCERASAIAGTLFLYPIMFLMYDKISLKFFEGEMG